jgi:hypothetical protein
MWDIVNLLQRVEEFPKLEVIEITFFNDLHGSQDHIDVLSEFQNFFSEHGVTFSYNMGHYDMEELDGDESDDDDDQDDEDEDE